MGHILQYSLILSRNGETEGDFLPAFQRGLECCWKTYLSYGVAQNPTKSHVYSDAQWRDSAELFLNSHNPATLLRESPFHKHISFPFKDWTPRGVQETSGRERGTLLGDQLTRPDLVWPSYSFLGTIWLPVMQMKSASGPPLRSLPAQENNDPAGNKIE